MSSLLEGGVQAVSTRALELKEVDAKRSSSIGVRKGRTMSTRVRQVSDGKGDPSCRPDTS